MPVLRVWRNNHIGITRIFKRQCFSAEYEIGCSECNIKLTRESKFILIYGKPKIEKDGYQECIDDWNRRVSDG